MDAQKGNNQLLNLLLENSCAKSMFITFETENC